MKLHALLIGITDYPGKAALTGCVDDTHKMSAYLKNLDAYFDDIKITTLHNAKAKKKHIVKHVKEIFDEIAEEDVAILYYSGHGAQEKTGGRFPTEHDGALECIVAHYEEDQESGFLLADKELRYLFAQLKSNPHFITLFDCCHSGSMVRAVKSLTTKQQVKRMVNYFDPRPYSEFIFSEEVSEVNFKTNQLPDSFKYKNHLHIAACGSGQSAFEDAHGGVFTNYLLNLLSTRNNQINYLELTRWAKLSLRDKQSEQQTPTITVQGEGKMNASLNWLNLPLEPTLKTGELNFDDQQGWVYNRGALMGIQPGHKLEVIKKNGDSFPATVKNVEPEFAIVGDLFDELGGAETGPLEVIPETVYSRLKVYINNIDLDAVSEKMVKDILLINENIQWVENPSAANINANIFNQTLYLSKPDWDYQPLALQIDLLGDDSDKIESQFSHQLKYAIKWNHFLTLENPGRGFDELPLKIEFKYLEETEWQDITGHAGWEIDPFPQRHGKGYFFRKFDVKITNVSTEKIHVGALGLGSNFSVQIEPLDKIVIDLKPGEFKILYQYGNKNSYMSIDHYMEVYNWPFEFWNLTFIVNNFEDFSGALNDFKQPGLEAPLTIDLDKVRTGVAKGSGSSEEIEDVRKKWGTVKTCIHLRNPTLNIVSGQLKQWIQLYADHEMLAPFVAGNYFLQNVESWHVKNESKPNVTGDDVNARDVKGFIMNAGNFWDDWRRHRLYKKSLRRFKNSPKIVAEGDSWFLYPLLIKDVLDYLMDEMPVRSIAAAGDELENYKIHGQLISIVNKEQPDFVLISGGGNDIIGEEIQHLLHNNVPKGSPAKDFLNDKFEKNIDKLKSLYTYFFTEIAKQDSVRQIFVHGYDYPLSSDDEKVLKKGWVNRYMKEKNILDLKDRQNIIQLLVDSFNTMLKALCSNNSLVTYVDNRGVINTTEWYDEIHPNDAGFEKIGNNFLKAINQFS